MTRSARRLSRKGGMLVPVPVAGWRGCGPGVPPAACVTAELPSTGDDCA